jgi:hypothetical protein
MNRYVFVLLVATANPVLAAVLDSDGINSLATGLDGTGVEIGEADLSRSGKYGYDDAAHSASGVIPGQKRCQEPFPDAEPLIVPNPI